MVNPLNPPYFPQGASVGEISRSVGGATLRDHFAAQALPAIAADILASNGSAAVTPSKLPGIIAAASYQLADAMLAARGKGPGAETDEDICRRCGLERRWSCNCDAGWNMVNADPLPDLAREMLATLKNLCDVSPSHDPSDWEREPARLVAYDLIAKAEALL